LFVVTNGFSVPPRCSKLHSTDGSSSNDNNGHKSSTPSGLPSDLQVTHSKAAVYPKVIQALTELGINVTRLVMPTRDNVAHLDSLLEATTALVEMKKLVDKVEQDIRVAKSRLGRKGSEVTDADADADADGEADAEGEVDAEGETNTGTGTGAALPQ